GLELEVGPRPVRVVLREPRPDEIQGGALVRELGGGNDGPVLLHRGVRGCRTRGGHGALARGPMRRTGWCDTDSAHTPVGVLVERLSYPRRTQRTSTRQASWSAPQDGTPRRPLHSPTPTRSWNETSTVATSVGRGERSQAGRGQFCRTAVYPPPSGSSADLRRAGVKTPRPISARPGRDRRSWNRPEVYRLHSPHRE